MRIPAVSNAGTTHEPLKGGKPVNAPLRNYVTALLACAATTAMATPLTGRFDPANIIMLFLLTVVLVGVLLGRGPAVLSSFVSVALFDFFFVPPRFSFTVDDPQYLLTFAIMLTVALLIGQLTGNLQRQAADAHRKERRAHALYEMARELAGALTTKQVMEITRRFLRAAIDARATFLLPDEADNLDVSDKKDGDWSQPIAPLLARLAYDNTACTDLDAPQPVGYFPLKAPGRVRGVLAIASPGTGATALYEHQEFLETVASLIAISIERLHYAQSTCSD